VYKFKALTLPVYYLNRTKTQTVYEADTDLQLLFLHIYEEIQSDTCQVELELHLLSKETGSTFSSPYRVLQFDKKEFYIQIMNNNCILPKRYYTSRCKYDFIPSKFQIENKTKHQFTKLFVKTYIDFNSFFTHLYRSLNYRPWKMFMLSFYCFVYGLEIPFHVLSDIYDQLHETARYALNLKEPFYLMTFLIRQYTEKSFRELDSILSLFGKQVHLFYEQSIQTYTKLNQISKSYTHEDTGGVVCSYALAKSFQGVTSFDIINSSSDNFRHMIESFKQTIEYNESIKYEEINQKIRNGMSMKTVCLNDLTRYILKSYSDPLFGFTIKKGDLKQKLSSAILKYYGNFPTPHIELKASSILCEMMAGAYNNKNEFASVELLNLKPFKPLLVENKGKEFNIVVLNGLNIDKPFPHHVIKLIEKHIETPSIESYLNYCYEIVDHISRCYYFYHEVINPFLPIYTINMDIDIYDKQYIQSFYESNEQWEIKENIFDNLKQLVLFVTSQVMKLPVSSDNTTFYLYESVRTDLHKINSAKFKLGFRLIVKFTTICFLNSSVVDKYLKILNIYRYKFQHLSSIGDDNIFDSAIYGQRNHEIRLPLNVKSDGSKPLVPIFFRDHRHSFHDALRMTSAFVHYRNYTQSSETILFVNKVPLPNAEILDELGESNIYKNIYSVKSNTNASSDISDDTFKSFKFSVKQKQKMINSLDRFSMGRLKRRENKKFLQIFENRDLKFEGRNKFSWLSGVKFCAITEHENASRNPCSYFVKLNPRYDMRYNKRECYIFCHCFSTTCKDLTRNFCVGKCLI